MSKRAERPKLGSLLDVDPNPDADAVPAVRPARFGPLVLWAMSASAFTVGVLGTVAYGVWVNHDQYAYAEAMASARQALWLIGSTSSTQTSSSAHLALSLSPPARETTVAKTDLAMPESSARVDHRAAPSPDSAVPPRAIGRLNRVSRFATHDRRYPASRIKPNGNPSARKDSLFSYRKLSATWQRKPARPLRPSVSRIVTRSEEVESSAFEFLFYSTACAGSADDHQERARPGLDGHATKTRFLLLPVSAWVSVLTVGVATTYDRPSASSAWTGRTDRSRAAPPHRHRARDSECRVDCAMGCGFTVPSEMVSTRPVRL